VIAGAGGRRRTGPDHGNRESGMALLVVLWTLLLLAVIAASLGTQARKQGYLARNAAALARAEAAADGGVVRGVAALMDPSVEQRWAADGSPHRFMLDGIEIEVRIVDEAGKVDLNTGAPELLASLLEVVGAGNEEALAIASAVAEQRSGAASGQPRGFETPAELLVIPGMTPALFERIAPFVTVLTHARGVDPSVAQRAVLLALAGRDAGAADAMLAARTAADGGTPAAVPPGDRVTESQHAVYAIGSVATAGSASFARQAIVRLTHSADLPFLVHSWQRVPSPKHASTGRLGG
jgi:general secretion pathway protein K